MRIKKTFVYVFLTLVVAAPLQAQQAQHGEQHWVDDFLRRYKPPSTPVESQGPSLQLVSQVLQTGIVPVTMADVINAMLDRNLDIQSNRFSPRSSYFSSLVFY